MKINLLTFKAVNAIIKTKSIIIKNIEIKSNNLRPMNLSINGIVKMSVSRLTKHNRELTY